jgi:hypothetical protein
MSNILEEKDAEAHSASKAKIPVKTGHGQDRYVEVEHGRPITVILEIIAAERGCGVEELIIVREGENEPLTEIVIVEAGYPHGHRHHVHHKSEVTVTVFYQAAEKHHPFKRSATVADVLVWALSVFPIDHSMATEFGLTRHDQKEELPGSEHIGHLAAGDCDLALDLVRGDIANGAVA